MSRKLFPSAAGPSSDPGPQSLSCHGPMQRRRSSLLPASAVTSTQARLTRLTSLQGSSPYDQFAAWRNTSLASLAPLLPSMNCSFLWNANFTAPAGTYLSQFLACNYGSAGGLFANVAADASALGMARGCAMVPAAPYVHAYGEADASSLNMMQGSIVQC